MADRHCGECHATITGNQRSGYCRRCMKHRCRYCAAALSPERLTGVDRPYCLDCSQKSNDRTKKRLAEDPDPRCYLCGASIDRWRTHPLCADCGRAKYLDRRRQLLRGPERVCRDCPRLLPKERIVSRCVDCQRRHSQRQPGRKLPCVNCRKRVRRRDGVHCRPCAVLYHNWLKAYHAGDPAARMMKTKREYVKWEQQR